MRFQSNLFVMKTLTIKDFSTRELLVALRAQGYAFFEIDSKDRSVFVGSRILKGGNTFSFYAEKKDILEELKTREHVPSKREGKLLRRLRSQTKMTEEQLRKHPKYGKLLVDSQQSYPRREIEEKDSRWYKLLYGSFFEERFYVK